MRENLKMDAHKDFWILLNALEDVLKINFDDVIILVMIKNKKLRVFTITYEYSFEEC